MCSTSREGAVSAPPAPRQTDPKTARIRGGRIRRVWPQNPTLPRLRRPTGAGNAPRMTMPLPRIPTADRHSTVAHVRLRLAEAMTFKQWALPAFKTGQSLGRRGKIRPHSHTPLTPQSWNPYAKGAHRVALTSARRLPCLSWSHAQVHSAWRQAKGMLFEGMISTI